MPVVIGAVGVFGGALIAGTTTIIALELAGLSIATSLVLQGLTPKPKSASSVANPLPFSIQNAEARAWCYGTGATGGAVKYWETTGSSNEDLWFVVALHDTPCQSFDNFIINNIPITFSAGVVQNVYVDGATPYMWRYDKLGALDQVAEANIVDAVYNHGSRRWHGSHSMKGVAYYTWHLKYSQKVYPQGIPTPRMVLKGRKLWDPRKDVAYGGTGSHNLNDESTWEWSNNAALALTDYLLGVKLNGFLIGGCNVPISQINVPAVVAAANICDETVLDLYGNNQARYTVDGFVDSVEDKQGVVSAMLLAMAGNLIVQGGQLVMLAGAAQTTVWPALTDDDLAGELSVSPTKSRQDKVNVLTSVYPEPAYYYDIVGGPRLAPAAYIAADGGLTLERELQHRFTADWSRVYRISKITLANFREQLTISGIFKPKAIGISAGNTFTWSSASAGYTNQKMFCLEREIQPDGSVRILARQETDSKYSWAGNEATAPTFQPNIAPVSPAPPAAPSGFAAVQTGGTVTFSWTDPANPLITGYDILSGAQGGSEGSATILTQNALTTAWATSGISSGSYTFYLRARDVYGQVGPSTSINFTVASISSGQNVASLFTIVSALNFTTNLKCCVDAGENYGEGYGEGGYGNGNGYGDDQSWVDLSAQGTHFFRGTDGTAEGSDPTFNGTPGDLLGSTYFKSDGGDLFTADASNPTWVNNLHKAGGAYTIVAIVYAADLANDFTILATCDETSAGSIGFNFKLKAASGGTLSNVIRAAGSVTVNSGSYNFATLQSQYAFVGVSIKDGQTSYLAFNANRSSFSGTYTTPSSSSASSTLSIGLGNIPNNDRIVALACWDTNLTVDQLGGIYSQLRALRSDLHLP